MNIIIILKKMLRSVLKTLFNYPKVTIFVLKVCTVITLTSV